jgi:cobalt-zinc-cadmium efflux system protein
LDRRLTFGAIINLLYVFLEASIGLWIGSLALIADAGHNLSDVVALLLAWGARRLERLPTSARRTYGWKNASVLATLANAILLLLAIGWIGWEALQRFAHPEPLKPFPIILVASFGVIINTATAVMLHSKESDLNIRAAMWHMAADALVSVAVVLGGLLIWAFEIPWIDAVLGLVVAGVLLVSTWSLLIESLNLALHAVPSDIDPTAVRNYLAGLPGVTEVHDLHIWPTSTRDTALTGHLVKPAIEDDDLLLTEITEHLQHSFGIAHATIQIERQRCALDCGRLEDHHHADDHHGCSHGSHELPGNP